MQNVFGLFRGMVYSTAEISGYETIRQWSSIINVGMNSWIGISMSLPNSSEEAISRFDSLIETRSSITFGYFGIEDVCRHPFPAMKTAVEMFLSLKICSNSSASPRAIANSTALTPDNMVVKRRVTSSNIGTFSSLLPPNEVDLIMKGKKDILLKLWYRSNDKFTTNPIIADKRIYTNMIETMLTQSFSFISVNPQPPPPKLELPATNVEQLEEINHDENDVKHHEIEEEQTSLPVPKQAIPPIYERKYSPPREETEIVGVQPMSDSIFPSF